VIWRRWARSYCTALMLNLALVGEIPTRRTGPAIGIERDVAMGPNRFDPREQANQMVITVPLVLAPPVRSGPGVN